MRWICTDHEFIERVAAPWAVERIGNIPPFKDCTGLALLDNMVLIAVVIYTDYNGKNCCIHVASDGSKRWMTKTFLRAAFVYPFVELNCTRITGLVAASNGQAISFDRHLGFKVEGRLRQAHVDGSDVIVFGMLRHECRFLKDSYGLGQGQRALSA